MRAMVIAVCVFAASATGIGARQAIEIDKTLQRVYDTAIMASDVREARLLKLVPEAGAGDDAVQRALENRLLILHEMARQQSSDPGGVAVEARRQQWTSSWPAGTDLPGMMKKCGTTNEALNAWFRTDLQIAAFLDAKYPPGDATRETKVTDWIAELRKRANLAK